MHPSLEHLVHLQRIETDADQRRRWLAELPERLAALEAAIVARREEREAAAQRLAENHSSRRALEKELAIVQGRLAKYKDQLMEVKTNKEYTAMQHEIATAEAGVRTFEDQMLDLMLQTDELSAGVKAADAALADEERKVAAERVALEADRQRIEGELASLARERGSVEHAIPAELVRLFADVAAKRRGLAVAPIKDGHCAACQVRLRAQMTQEIRRGERLHQCESCGRILYIPPAANADAPPASA